MPLESFTDIDLVDLVIILLSTYRLSVMFTHRWEVGPWFLLQRFRRVAGVKESWDGGIYGPEGSFADMLTCYFCNSPWIGLLLALAYAGMLAAGWPAKLALAPLAASGFTIIVAKYTERVQVIDAGE